MTVELAGKSNRKTISRWRQFGIADGFLWLRTEHIPRKRAAEYLFDVRRCKMLAEHAGDGVLRLLADTNGGGEG